MTPQNFEKLGALYLGADLDPNTGERSGELTLYDSRDLCTHAVCVGMTGSGKTGLGVVLLEEALIDGVPALVVDPKGDMGNLLLTFPELDADSFEPWINPEDASRKGIPVAEHAAGTATLWKSGLAKWGEDGARIQRLKDAADFTIYTPGSNAGTPISLLQSFNAPGEALRADRDLFQQSVAATVTGLLALVGIDADPIRSREHILLSTILTRAWSAGEDLDIAEIIQAVQDPDFERVGVLDLESFFPETERFALAMAINGVVASPGFAAWLEGEPLDIGALLYTPEGKPRCAVLSISHLSDAERMFFVTLLFSELISWMRAQPGTSSLRALAYMDEIYGYLPPVANPASKQPLLTLLKQARAFGVGLVLATQNPADIDYKALSNAGTWFVGRLQTERDKLRLLDGLDSAMDAGGAAIPRAQLDRMISGLGKRRFILHNIHEGAPELFETRWAMSYLRGPLTRSQIKQLTGPAGEHTSRAARVASVVGDLDARPVIPPGIDEYFVPVVDGRSDGRIVYRPMVLGTGAVHFEDESPPVSLERTFSRITVAQDGPVPLNWENTHSAPFDESVLEARPVDNAEFVAPPPPMVDAGNWRSWERDLTSHLYESERITLFRCRSPKLVSEVGESEGAFRARLGLMLREKRDEAVDKLRERFGARMQRKESQIFDAEQRVEQERSDARGEQAATMIDIGESILGSFLGGGRRRGRRRSAGSAFRRAERVRRAHADTRRAEDKVLQLQQELDELEAELRSELQELETEFDPTGLTLTTKQVKPLKRDCRVRFVGFVWVPYRVFEDGSRQRAFEKPRVRPAVDF